MLDYLANSTNRRRRHARLLHTRASRADLSRFFPMTISAKAGKPAEDSMLVNVARLMAAYYANHPDPAAPEQRVSFGTSGHRGTSGNATFTEDHIVATTQAICDYRKQQNVGGPVFVGMDTHALSEAAFVSALEVLAANEVETMIDAEGGYTPTPVVSH